MDSTLIFIYIDGTSDFNNLPTIGIGINDSDGEPELTFASLPGVEVINGEVKRIGRFRLKSSEVIDFIPSITWDFEGKISTIITGAAFEDITNPTNHISELGEIKLLNVLYAEASAFDEGFGPEKTIDGLDYSDGNNSSRWKAHPMPQWISYDLGSEHQISSLKISFYNFTNRIYEFSVSVSNDNIIWTEIVSNANSLAEEWTIVNFSSINTRFLKIDLHSSTNNPEQYANIWEVEIYGLILPTSSQEIKTDTHHFELLQNYPNPFNPTTRISFNLKHNSNINLSIYNILGEVVAVLANEFLESGKHEYTFNGENLSSGIYMYKLNVDERFIDIKKMMLIK
jgi:hypothetical protein